MLDTTHDMAVDDERYCTMVVPTLFPLWTKIRCAGQEMSTTVSMKQSLSPIASCVVVG